MNYTVTHDVLKKEPQRYTGIMSKLTDNWYCIIISDIVLFETVQTEACILVIVVYTKVREWGSTP